MGTLATIATINLSTISQRYTTVAAVPERRVGIVFGAQVRPDHSLSPILRDRVDGAITLYRSGKIHKLLMSGDNSRAHYDEPTAMKDYAVMHGVPAADIALDYAGFSTYDTCYRARAVFGLSSATLITSAYHLPRAIYTCDRLGLQTVGLGVPDFSKYPDLRIPYTTREWLADQKTWWEVNVWHPRPTFIGPSVKL